MLETDIETPYIKNEYHINHVEHFYPNATHVTNFYGDSRRRMADVSLDNCQSSAANSPQQERQRDDILSYVHRLMPYVVPSFVTTYDQLWRDILALPEVAAEVYNPGKQQGTTFNRNLVAAIICMMKDAGIITETNVSRLTELLQGDKEHSVRAALATPPSSRVIYNKVRARIEELKV